MKCSIPFMQNWDFDTWDGADGGAGEAPFTDKENEETQTSSREKGLKSGSSWKEEIKERHFYKVKG